MPKDPLLIAQETLTVATEAAGRARRYYDYLNKEKAYDTLVSIHDNLIEQLRKLEALYIELHL